MDLNNPAMDFSALAAGMGVPGVTLDSPDELQETVKAMLAEGGPHLLELVVEGYEFR